MFQLQFYDVNKFKVMQGKLYFLSCPNDGIYPNIIDYKVKT